MLHDLSEPLLSLLVSDEWFGGVIRTGVSIFASWNHEEDHQPVKGIDLVAVSLSILVTMVVPGVPGLDIWVAASFTNIGLVSLLKLYERFLSYQTNS